MLRKLLSSDIKNSCLCKKMIWEGAHLEQITQFVYYSRLGVPPCLIYDKFSDSQHNYYEQLRNHLFDTQDCTFLPFPGNRSLFKNMKSIYIAVSTGKYFLYLISVCVKYFILKQSEVFSKMKHLYYIIRLPKNLAAQFRLQKY